MVQTADTGTTHARQRFLFNLIFPIVKIFGKTLQPWSV